jgi:hypothetical protein
MPKKGGRVLKTIQPKFPYLLEQVSAQALTYFGAFMWRGALLRGSKKNLK